MDNAAEDADERSCVLEGAGALKKSSSAVVEDVEGKLLMLVRAGLSRKNSNERFKMSSRDEMEFCDKKANENECSDSDEKRSTSSELIWTCGGNAALSGLAFCWRDARTWLLPDRWGFLCRGCRWYDAEESGIRCCCM